MASGPEELGSRIRRAMEEIGLTQTQLAHRLDVHPQTISNWIRGKYDPGLPNLRRLAEITKQQLSFFVAEPVEVEALSQTLAALREAAEVSARAGADLAQVLAELRPLLAEQHDVVRLLGESARSLETVLVELRRRESANRSA